jgi:hypothetical protein
VNPEGTGIRNIRCTLSEKQKQIPYMSVSHNDVGKDFQVIWDVTLGRLVFSYQLAGRRLRGVLDPDSGTYAPPKRQ